MRVFYDPRHQLHDPDFEVTAGQRIAAYEVTARAEAIRTALETDGGFEMEPSRSFGVGPILAVHDEGLVRYLETAWQEWRSGGTGVGAIMPDAFLHPALRAGMGTAPLPLSPCGQAGSWCFDTATPIVPGTYEATRAACDVALTAADAVLDGARAVYALTRPPGHHSARSVFGGYCYLNQAAVASDWLARRTGGVVGVLDLDFHHGNGTQQIFYERADVAYASIHADPARTFPYFAGYAAEAGADAGAGRTFNQPLPAGTPNDAYLEAVDRALDWFAAIDPMVVLVSLGFDTYGQDPIGNFALSTPVYHEVGRRVASFGRPLVIVQEGGYDVTTLGRNAREWLRGADGRAPAFAAAASSEAVA